jgi:hypothetical protein
MEVTADERAESYRQAKKVYEEIESGRVLLPGQREEMRALIETLRLEAAELIGLARESHPTVWWKDLPGDLPGLIEYLARLPSTTRGAVLFHPALDFIERAALRADPLGPSKVAAKLRQLSEATGKLFGLESGYFSLMRPRLAQQAANPTRRTLYVQIDLDPELGVDPDAYHISGCVWVHDGAGIFLEGASEPEEQPLSAVPRAGLPAAVLALANDLAGPVRRAGDELVLEVFVPAALRNHACDQWEETIHSGRSRKIGAELPIVVRDRERLQDTGLAGSYWVWQRLAEDARRLWQQRQPLPVAWIETPDAATPDSIRRTVQDAGGAVCLVLMLTPEELNDEEHDAALQEALDAGVPLAIWLRRRSAQVADARAELEKYLLDKAKDPCLCQLPRTVWEYRRKDRPEDSCYLGAGLTLLWDDDPRRVPPIWHRAGRRRAPEARGTIR